MDLDPILRELRAELKRVEDAISALEAVCRQGRRSMGEDERQQVSIRMVKYWAWLAENDEDPAVREEARRHLSYACVRAAAGDDRRSQGGA
jgi:hypothetical protein